MVFHPCSLLDRLERQSQTADDAARREIETEPRPQVLFRHSGWARNRSLVAASLARTDQRLNRCCNYRDCGSHAYVLRSVENPDRVRLAGSCCHDRFCLPCGRERAAIIASNALDLVADKEVRFVTITINTDDETLAESLDKLYSSFLKLRRTRTWTRSVFGGVAFLELKRSKDDSRWHPHLHCIVDGIWIDLPKLRSDWWRITGDSFIIDAKPCSNNRNVAYYATKYASKPFNNTFVNKPERLDEAVLALRGKKLCLTFGTWRGHLLTVTPSDDDTWERVDSLESIITQAANGNVDSLKLLHLLSNQDLNPILARAPPQPEVQEDRTPLETQSTFPRMMDRPLAF